MESVEDFVMAGSMDLGFWLTVLLLMMTVAIILLVIVGQMGE